MTWSQNKFKDCMTKWMHNFKETITLQYWEDYLWKIQ